MALDYKGLAEFHSMSERTLRRWEKEKPGVFDVYYNQFIAAGPNNSNHQSTVIMALSLKGGVGKSTICDALCHYLSGDIIDGEESDAVVLNLDLAQSASLINGSYTIDYINHIDDIGVSDMIEKLMEKHRVVIIDTPGDPTAEVWEALPYCNRVIVPMTIANRAEEATLSTLNTYFGSGAPLGGEFSVFFFYNAYTDKKKRDESYDRFKVSFGKFKPSENITLKPRMGSLDASNSISTVEFTGKSLFQLARENRTAYGIAAKKITLLCQAIEEHFGL